MGQRGGGRDKEGRQKTPAKKNSEKTPAKKPSKKRKASSQDDAVHPHLTKRKNNNVIITSSSQNTQRYTITLRSQTRNQ